MMYTALYQYLIKHKSLSVPGIGTFLLQRIPAAVDFPNRRVTPPGYYFTMHYPASSTTSGFFASLANALGISDREAVVQFNNFAFDLRKQITSGDPVKWKGVGTISKGLGDEVKFFPENEMVILEKPVPAQKVLRSHPEHHIKVGEDEITSSEMAALLHPEEEKKSSWWLPTSVAGLLTIIFMGFYFSQHGVSLSSAANKTKLTPADTTVTYIIKP